jgi:hypothetical protein
MGRLFNIDVEKAGGSNILDGTLTSLNAIPMPVATNIAIK